MDRLPEIEQAQATGTDGARLAWLNERAHALVRAGDPERALPFAQEAQRLATIGGEDLELGRALCSIGTSHYLLARYAVGLNECLHAAVLGERAGNAELIASALIQASACQYQMGAREEALQAIYQALEIIDSTGPDDLLIRAHNALGVLLSHKNRFDEAEEHYVAALEIGSSGDDVIYAARVKLNYAGLYRERGVALERDGNRAAALESYRTGLRLCDQVMAGPGCEGAFNRAHCVGTRGELFSDLGDTQAAEKAFAEMLEYGVQMNNPHQQAEALMNRGRLHMKVDRVDRARKDFEQALAFASGANVKQLTAEGFRSLADWFEAAGDLREALAYQKRFNALSEELRRAEYHATGVAHQIWIQFQRLRRETKGHDEKVEVLARAANEDCLTGLPNRRHLDAYLDQLVSRVRQNGVRACVGIVDIDHFKSINDSGSHSVGDKVLQSVAGMIASHCRDGDVSARYGGDEFVICLSGVRLHGAMAVLERLRALVAHRAWDSLHPGLKVTLSIGVAEANAGDSAATLMERVDVALYRAKRSGRNCISSGAIS